MSQAVFLLTQQPSPWEGGVIAQLKLTRLVADQPQSDGVSMAQPIKPRHSWDSPAIILCMNTIAIAKGLGHCDQALVQLILHGGKVL